MASVQFTDVQARPPEFLELTSVTLAEFQPRVPPGEAAFHAHLAAWRLEGQPRTARRFTVDKHGPLPTPEERWFCILVSLKTSALQVVQGRLFGMGQSTAQPWMHVLLPALLAARRPLGDAPARSLTALAQRLGVTEAAAATGVVPLEEGPAPGATVPAAAPASPLGPMTGPHGAASAPKTLLNRRRGGRVHDKPMADAPPSPWPAGSRLFQALGFLAFPLPQVKSRRPTKKPRGAALTLEQHVAHQALPQRRRRIEQVNSRVKRCRLGKDRLRLWKQGVRALVLALCCALHHFRVRLTPWQPII